MFSASARAFSLASTRPAARLPYLVARMSSAGEPDTTIVDVCKKKIEDALGSDKVEVTGMCFCVENRDILVTWLASYSYSSFLYRRL